MNPAADGLHHKNVKTPETDFTNLTLGQVPVDKDAFELDVIINQGYNAYSAELLRLALLVITGLSALWLKVYLPDAPSKCGVLAASAARLPATEWSFILAFVSAALSAGAALVHRYTSVDGLACHLEELRRRVRNRPGCTGEPQAEEQERKLNVARWMSRLLQWFAAVPGTSLGKSSKSDADLADEQKRQRYARFTWSARLLRLSAALLFLGLLFSLSFLVRVLKS